MTQSTGSEAPAEAASDAPTGSPAQPNPTLPDGFGDLDRRAIDTARVLAMDAVQKVGNGHPGTAMSMAPTAYLLFQKWLKHDPSDPNWVGPRPVRALDGPLEPDPLRAAVPQRLRHGARGPRGAAHLGLADPRPPRGEPHPRRRDHDRSAGSGRRQRRRHGDGGPPRARPARPRRPRGREPVRPHHLGLRLRRRPGGGRQRRGVLAGRHPAAGQPGPRLRRQQDLHRGRHERRLHRGRRQALRGLRLARPARRRRRGPRRGRRRLRRRQGRDRPPVDHRAEDDHRLARPQQAEHRRRARLGARRGRGQGHQEGPRPRPGEVLRRRRRGDRARPQGRRPRPGGARRLAAALRRLEDEQPGRRRAAGPDEHPHPARGLGREAAELAGRRRRASPPARPPARCWPRSTRSSPSSGAGRRTWRRATTPPSRANRRSCPPTGRRRCGPAAPTAARCTSVSASTRWARS